MVCQSSLNMMEGPQTTEHDLLLGQLLYRIARDRDARLIQSGELSGDEMQQQLAAFAVMLLYFLTHLDVTCTRSDTLALLFVACQRVVLQVLTQPPPPGQDPGAGGSSDNQQASKQQQLPPRLVMQEAMSFIPTVLSRLKQPQPAAAAAGSSSSNAAAVADNSFSEKLLALLLSAAGAFLEFPSPGCKTPQPPAVVAAMAVWARRGVRLVPQLEAYARSAAVEAVVLRQAWQPGPINEYIEARITSQAFAREGLGDLLTPAPSQPRPGPLLAAAIEAGCGSKMQQHTVGLLCSLLKLHAVVSQQPVAAGMQEKLRGTFPLAAVAQSATVLVEAAVAQSPPPSHKHVLPLLNLFGRCCRQLAVHLALQTDRQLEHEIVLQLLHTSVRDACVLRRMEAALQAYLQQEGVAEGLRAAGYDMEPVLQQFAAAVAVLESSRQLSQLQELGTTLCAALPVPQLCNNPACSNLQGPTEAQLVSGSRCTCSCCRVAHYCNRDSCQRPHWKAHKPSCKALAAAAAAGDEVVVESA